ncbi:hypothetical protein [Chlamydia felis Fe/C-56]|uniref:Uncharacterized protein n=1 Tax=Chlamydia felis (strain Fe/C-56) TaxID=264202 RepID=Q254Y4_CHLFF|nr:hypothetical protein [Chlamydia felis]BAE81154.1 hypothetical protein [Chlamydia felis Fe/C-56]
MSTSVERPEAPAHMTAQQFRDRCNNLTLEMNTVLVVPLSRLVMEIATAILGAACLALSVAMATGLLAVGCCYSVWLVPVGFALGAALLTSAVMSAILRQGELRRERSWRSHALRWNSFAHDLQRSLAAKSKHRRHKTSDLTTSSTSENSH